MSRRLALLGGLLMGAAIGLPAQAIRGKVVEAGTGRPVSGAIVEVRDADGYLTKRVVTSATGGSSGSRARLRGSTWTRTTRPAAIACTAMAP